MGQQQSKDELLYQQVNYGNSEGIKALHREGAGLEWIDQDGKTPLTLACMNPSLFDVAKTLIEIGANVNAYRAGRHSGTPLHHATKRGLDQTVKLLLSHGANALVMNDHCQTPLDVARIKGFSNVVRTIESHICLFSGWLRELYGPGYLELLAPQLLSKKVWVVVLPCGSQNLRNPCKLELAVYANSQDAQPRTIIALWKASMEEPNFSQPDPTVIITDSTSLPRRWRRRRGITKSQVPRTTRIKLAAAGEGDKQQLWWFCNACKGIPQVFHPAFPFSPAPHVVTATVPPISEDVELAMALNASLQSAMQERPPHVVTATVPPISEDVDLAMALSASLQSAMQERPPHLDIHPGSQSDSSTSRFDSESSSSEPASPKKGSSSGSRGPETALFELVAHLSQTQIGPSTSESRIENSAPASIPSSPPLEDGGPIQYPSIDNSPLDFAPAPVTTDAMPAGKSEAGTPSSSCVICLDAPIEGACIPCGHMAGCMSCLNEIKAKKWGCPVCRAKIDQVVRLYAV